MTSVSRRYPLPRALLATGPIVALAFTACASTPPAPTESLEAARVAIASAETAEAGRYAAVELGEARSRLTSANTFVEKKQMVLAERMAEQSRAQAELAAAKTGATKAKAVNDEMKESNSTLIEEMKRSSGDRS